MVAIGAIPAGYAYVKDPSGAGLGVTVELLANSPLKDFLIPGLFLLIVNGFCQLGAAMFSIMNKPVAGKIALFLGFVLMVWIVIQVVWIGLSSFMQPLFFFVGLFEMALGWTIIRKT
jgi:hypothetical protein